MLDIHFSCTGIKDVAEFIRMYPLIFPENFQGHFSGETSGVFEITVNEKGEKWMYPKNELKEILKLEKLEAVVNDFQSMSIENQNLKNEIERLNSQLVKTLPKQNLEVNELLVNTINLYRESGLSFQKIADKLNADGYKNSRGNLLNTMQVKRLFDKNNKANFPKEA